MPGVVSKPRGNTPWMCRRMPIKRKGSSIDRDLNRRKLKRQHETEEQREQRLSTLSKAKEQRLAKETETERNQRLSALSKAQEQRLAKETETERNQRLSAISAQNQRKR